MVDPVVEQMKDKSYIQKMANAGVDVIRSLTFMDTNQKRCDKYKECALNQLDAIIKSDESESRIAEAENARESFLDILSKDRKYSFDKEFIISYFNDYCLLARAQG